MKRLDRLGSIAFLTIAISFVFHVIAMSFDEWIVTSCVNCNQSNPFLYWHTSLTKRCYSASVASIFLTANQSNVDLYEKSFETEFCVPNQYLTYKKPNYALQCLSSAIEYPHLVCALSIYNPDYCQCDTSVREKVVIAMTVLTAVILALMLILSHIATLARFNYILRWLLPLSAVLLILAAIFIIVALSITGSRSREDLTQIVYMSNLVSAAFQNKTLPAYWESLLNETTKNQYHVRVGWCLGVEILALQFTVASLLIYALMFVVKDRPE